MFRNYKIIILCTLTLVSPLYTMEPETNWDNLGVNHYVETYAQPFEKIQAFSSKYFAYHKNRDIYLLDRYTGTHTQLTSPFSKLYWNTMNIHNNILSCARGHIIYQWNCDTQHYLGFISIDHNQVPPSDLDDTDNTLASCTDNGYVTLYDIHTQQQKLSIPTKEGCSTINYAPNDIQIAVQKELCGDDHITICDTRAGIETLQLNIPEEPHLFCKGTNFCPKSTLLASAYSHIVYIYDLRNTQTPLYSIPKDYTKIYAQPFFVNEHIVIIPKIIEGENQIQMIDTQTGSTTTKKLDSNKNTALFSKYTKELIFANVDYHPQSTNNDVIVYDFSSFFNQEQIINSDKQPKKISDPESIVQKYYTQFADKLTDNENDTTQLINNLATILALSDEKLSSLVRNTNQLKEELTEDIATCPICFEQYNDIFDFGRAGKETKTKCNHILCATCFSSLRSPVCPLCRAELS